MKKLLMLAMIVTVMTSCKKTDNNNLTLTPLTVTDINGNIYHTVTIGTQVWMVENLKTTKYNDGTSIPLIIDSTTWKNLTTPGYCWYNNDSVNYKNPYGALYNWFTVNTGKLAPAGWHIPTDAEWTVLMTFLGGEMVAGGKMKETGTTHWEAPNSGATNTSGFTALAAGLRGPEGYFAYLPGRPEYAYFWSASECNTDYAWTRYLFYLDANVSRPSFLKTYGYSVRCVKMTIDRKTFTRKKVKTCKLSF